MVDEVRNMETLDDLRICFNQEYELGYESEELGVPMKALAAAMDADAPARNFSPDPAK